MTPDRANAGMEYGGVLFALHNCFILIQDEGQVMGVSIAATVFFTFWGAWNIFYYRWLGQLSSGVAARGLVAANGLWLILYIIYSLTPTGNTL